MTLIDSLSEREKEVASLLLQGKSNKQIAQELGVTTRTVEFHVTHIYEKLGVKSRAEAIVRLSEPRLRESTGAETGQPAVGLRQPTVENAGDPSENGENLTISFRRKPLKKLLLIGIALVAIPCLIIGLIWVGGFALFMGNPFVTVGKTFSETTVAVPATYTPYVPVIPAAPTYTPLAPGESLGPTKTPYAVTATPAPVITDIVVQNLGGNRYRYEGVNFTLDPALGSQVTGQVVLENPASQDGPFWEVHPQYVRLNLQGYPLAGTAWNPVIAVYPVADYRRVDPQAAKTLDALQTLLEQKPADPGSGEASNVLPFLPFVNAGQSFHSNVKYLDFQNGSGVRYLTLYAQYPAPINNQDLFYTFQGLTADGRHLISITLPVSHPSLPANEDALGIPTQQAIAGDYGNYRARTSAALNAQPGGSFTPDLAKLDTLVGSIQIDR